MCSLDNVDIEDCDEKDDEDEFKNLFIQNAVESGCKIAYVTDEYISIKDNRRKLINKLLSNVPEESHEDIKAILDDIDATYNQQSAKEFDCVLGLLFDRINILPQLISVPSLKNIQKSKK